jgi:multidrug efflux system outer membrane protein
LAVADNTAAEIRVFAIWCKAAGKKGTAGACCLAALLICGCEVGPDYHPPAQTMPAAWETTPTSQPSQTVLKPAQLQLWWTNFNDPILNSLVSQAVESNLDLAAATERIRQARATVGVARAGLWPTVNATGAYTRAGGSGISTGDLWEAGLDATWELDIFGGTRRSVEAARASLDAAVEDRRDVLVTLLGEVASDYILLRSEQQEIVIARENLDVDSSNARLTRQKQKLGTGTELDVAQADAQVATTAATLAGVQLSEQQTIYAVGVLLGLTPTALEPRLSATQEVPSPPAELPVGLPSDLLRRRPDIRRAERQLAAATAQIGVATAAWFPQFSLTGTAGVEGSRLPALGNWGSNNVWSAGPSVTWQIFDAGQIAANVEVQNSLQAQALVVYRQTVLTALQEVQNALVALAQEQQRRQALSDAVVSNQRAVVLATRLYKQGLTDFLSVLDAERSLYGTQDALVLSNAAVGADAVALYEALGGGWEMEGSSPSTRPTE